MTLDGDMRSDTTPPPTTPGPTPVPAMPTPPPPTNPPTPAPTIDTNNSNPTETPTEQPTPDPTTPDPTESPTTEGPTVSPNSTLNIAFRIYYLRPSPDFPGTHMPADGHDGIKARFNRLDEQLMMDVVLSKGQVKNPYVAYEFPTDSHCISAGTHVCTWIVVGSEAEPRQDPHALQNQLNQEVDVVVWDFVIENLAFDLLTADELL